MTSTTPLTEVLALMAQSAANSLELFDELDFADVVDPLQEFAERTGLIVAIGQDAVQAIISAAFAGVPGFEPQPVADNYAAQLVRQWEMADPRDRWRHTGELPPDMPAPEPYHLVSRDGVASPAELQRMVDNCTREREGPPQSTIDAFRFVVRQGDPAALDAWLRNHADEAAALLADLHAEAFA